MYLVHSDTDRTDKKNQYKLYKPLAGTASIYNVSSWKSGEQKNGRLSKTSFETLKLQGAVKLGKQKIVRL